jgi:hypothetical protein
MITIRCFPGDELTLTAKKQQCNGDILPSTTQPSWALSSHTLAEFKEMSPSGHSIKVIALATGFPVVTATLDAGTVDFTLVIVDPPILTSEPRGDYERNPPLRQEFECFIGPPE